MKFFEDGDSEPAPGIQVLRTFIRMAGDAKYLARFQHGWLWVNSKTELDRGDKTPLSWRFAIADRPGNYRTKVSTLSDVEHVDWLAS